MSDIDALIGLVTEIHRDVKALDAKLEKHMIEESNELTAKITNLISSAFPNGDPPGHKAAHDAWLRKTETNAKFWEKMRFELCRWGLIGFLGWAVYSLWESLLKGPK